MTVLKKSAIILASSFIAACSFNSTDRNVKEAQAKIAQRDFFPNEQAAMFVDAPTRAETPKPYVLRPAWASIEVEPLNAMGGMPLHSLLTHATKNSKLRVRYHDDIDANEIVHVSFAGDVESALTAISVASGQSYSVEGDVLNWSQYITKAFSLSQIPGEYNFKIGSQSQRDAATGTKGRAATFGDQSDEFTSISGTAQDALTEFEDIVKTIVGEKDNKGTVSVSRSTGTLVVRTTKSRMDQVESYFNEVQKILNRQVALQIQFIRFSRTSGSSHEIDWAGLQESAKGLLTFNGQGGDSFNGSTPISFSAKKYGGRSNGSQIFVDLLQQYGTVTVENQPTLVTQVNRVASIELNKLQGYIASTEVTPSNSIYSSEPAVSMTEGTVRWGHKLLLMANISNEDLITLHLSSDISDLEGIDVKKVHLSSMESPKLLQNKLNSTVSLRSGDTMILGGLKMKNSNSNKESPLSRFLPTRGSENSEHTEFIALVTPVIVEN